MMTQSAKNKWNNSGVSFFEGRKILAEFRFFVFSGFFDQDEIKVHALLTNFITASKK